MLADTDFKIYALMERHLLEYIVSRIEERINPAQGASKQGFDKMKEDVFQEECQVAIDRLEEAVSKCLRTLTESKSVKLTRKQL